MAVRAVSRDGKLSLSTRMEALPPEKPLRPASTDTKLGAARREGISPHKPVRQSWLPAGPAGEGEGGDDWEGSDLWDGAASGCSSSKGGGTHVGTVRMLQNVGAPPAPGAKSPSSAAGLPARRRVLAARAAPPSPEQPAPVLVSPMSDLKPAPSTALVLVSRPPQSPPPPEPELPVLMDMEEAPDPSAPLEQHIQHGLAAIAHLDAKLESLGKRVPPPAPAPAPEDADQGVCVKLLRNGLRALGKLTYKRDGAVGLLSLRDVRNSGALLIFSFLLRNI